MSLFHWMKSLKKLIEVHFIYVRILEKYLQTIFRESGKAHEMRKVSHTHRWLLRFRNFSQHRNSKHCSIPFITTIFKFSAFCNVNLIAHFPRTFHQGLHHAEIYSILLAEICKYVRCSKRSPNIKYIRYGTHVITLRKFIWTVPHVSFFNYSRYTYDVPRNSNIFWDM